MNDDLTKVLAELDLRLTMDRDRNIAELEKLLTLVRSENNEARFRRLGIDWMVGKWGFDHAIKAVKYAHEHHESPLLIIPEAVRQIEIRSGEELGKPGTIRASVSQLYPQASFECYMAIEDFVEGWRRNRSES